MEIGIIGLGTVGRSVAATFSPVATLVTYDPAHDDRYPDQALARCDFAVVCVDTPSASDGSCDTSKVREALHRLPVERVLLRSTVAPGTTDELVALTGKAICFSPEFLGETPFHADTWPAGERSIPFVVLGGEPTVRRYFIEQLVPLLGPAKTYFQCTALEAELVKYAENAFLATKVTFVNELFEICEALGADWHTVREGWLLDPRVGRSHSAVFAGDRGFDGKCLPKDLRAIVRAAAAAGYSAELLSEVLASNDRFRRTHVAAPPLEDA